MTAHGLQVAASRKPYESGCSLAPLPPTGGRVHSEATARVHAADAHRKRQTVSLDAYRRTVGGSITIGVTGTDNPVPTQFSDRKTTPTQPAPAVPEAPAKAPDVEREPGGKKRLKK